MKRNMVQRVALGVAASILVGTVMIEASDAKSHETNAAKDFDYEVFTSLDEASAYGEIYGHETYNSSNLEEIGETDVEMFLCINGRTVALFPQFKDPQEAMENAKTVCKDILEVLADYYGLDELSESNWESYKDLMYQYLYEKDTPDWYTETNECFVKLTGFFDIYSDKYYNEEILELVENTNTLYELLYETDFEGDLPYFVWDSYVDDLAMDADISEESGSVDATSFNVSDACNYAVKYATSYNSNYGYISGHDCTNFASQIMVAGGHAMTGKWRQYEVLSTKKYTKAWCNANEFVTYWGISKTYSDHKSFSTFLTRGTFITYDKCGDGKWDHLGFVTFIGTDYTDAGYLNYQVAQHTKDYLEWAGSDKCGWDTLEDSYPDIVYGRVSRNRS